ncbi:MAG: DUF4476 domain-containing protein [Bacteroidota bacterium]|nr:DUF4476 domain-containing protein [Bacteroidota bacterium]
MKTLYNLLFFVSFFSLGTKAQQNHFIYFQSENHQQFYVKFDNKILNSAPSGYLIIPKLIDSTYSFVIGFSQNNDEQQFNCVINRKDLGFIIKNSGEKEWHIINLETLNALQPGDVIKKNDSSTIATEKETDAFSIMLANAVHDSSILQKNIVKESFAEKPAIAELKDSAQIVALNDVAILRPSLIKKKIKTKAKAPHQVGKQKKDVAANLPLKNNRDSTQKDSVQNLIANKDVALNDSSIKKDIAKETTPELKSLQKDTLQVIPTNNNLQKDSLQSIAFNDRALKDTLQNATSDNDYSVPAKKQKIKKKKKSAEISNSAIEENGIVKESDIGKIKIENKLDTLNTIVETPVSIIKRKFKKNTKQGLEMLYVDDNGDTKDTIRILIPTDKKKKKDEEIKEEQIVSAPLQEEKQKNTLNDKKISEEEKKIIQEANKEQVLKSTMINSDCKNFATDEDFLKIRKKMVAGNNDEEMIKAARKIFKTKCFTTEQIKNLSVLFLKDEGKYMFFDAAYPFVSDSENYLSLQNQLIDDYYITRFKAMIHK